MPAIDAGLAGLTPLEALTELSLQVWQLAWQLSWQLLWQLSWQPVPHVAAKMAPKMDGPRIQAA